MSYDEYADEAAASESAEAEYLNEGEIDLTADSLKKVLGRAARVMHDVRTERESEEDR